MYVALSAPCTAVASSVVSSFKSESLWGTEKCTPTSIKISKNTLLYVSFVSIRFSFRLYSIQLSFCRFSGFQGSNKHIDENQASIITTETGKYGYKRSDVLKILNGTLSSFSRAVATTWGRLRLRAAESTYLALGVYSRARKCAIRVGRPGWHTGSTRK